MPTKKEPTVFDPHFWGLSTRLKHKAPPPPPREEGPRRPFASGAYQDAPWGPFPPSPNQDKATPGNVLRIIDPAVELKFTGEWRTISRHDLPEDLSWGRLLVGVQSVSGEEATTIDTQPIVEVRIIQYTNGVGEIVLEAAAGQRQEVAPASSPGPVGFEWEVGEIPDGYEVQARARRGGYADAVQETADAETLLVVVTGRFHR